MPNMVVQLAKTDGVEIHIDGYLPGGRALRQMTKDEKLIQKIKSQPWDYVILQSDDISAFPDMYSIELNTLSVLKKLICANNSQTQIVYEMIWGGRDGVRIRELNGQVVYYSFKDYIHKICEGTTYLADEQNVTVAPVGWAWYLAIQQDPSLRYQLFSSDLFHPAPMGSYLAACVIYATLLQKDIEDNSYLGPLSQKTAFNLQQIASMTVLNQLWRRSSAVK
jgi:hypothetical protein